MNEAYLSTTPPTPTSLVKPRRVYFYLATTTGNPFYGKGKGEARAWSLVAGFKPEGEPVKLIKRWDYAGDKTKVKVVKSEFNELPMLEAIYSELDKYFPIHPTFHLPDKTNLLVGYGLHTHDLPILLAKIQMFKMKDPVKRFKSLFQCRGYDIQQNLSFMGKNWLAPIEEALQKKGIAYGGNIKEHSLPDLFTNRKYKEIEDYVTARLEAYEALDKSMRGA
jgi:hypothetical protein